MFSEEIKIICPPNAGWLETKLSTETIDRLWFYIQKYKNITNANNTLVGNISNSWELKDDDNWFWKNVLLELCCKYADVFGNLGEIYSTVTNRHNYCLDNFWVNFQKQHEFNPIHIHKSCIYSFVIWMKIPTDYREQHKIPISANSNSPSASNFNFSYLNILGHITQYQYFLDKNSEGTILFFPSQLNHEVYPFYNCNEERISISGNIALDTSYFIQ
jgi:hypothetical protein